MTRRDLLTAMAIVLLPGMTTVRAQDHGRIERPIERAAAPGSGLPPGQYTIKLLAPTLAPALSVDEQVFSVCYSAGDAAAQRNPVMPAEQAARCSSHYMRIWRRPLVFCDVSGRIAHSACIADQRCFLSGHLSFR
jgi:hypothetical protein